MDSTSPSTPPWSSLSVSEALALLEKATVPADVKAILSRSDDQLLMQAWALLNPVQRGALLLTRAFRGASILSDDTDEPPGTPDSAAELAELGPEAD